MKQIYFDIHREFYSVRESIINLEIQRFVFLLEASQFKHWKDDLFNDEVKLIEDPTTRLEKKEGLAIITVSGSGDNSRPYIIELNKLKKILLDWYNAIAQKPVGILIFFNGDDIQVIPDIEVLGEDELARQIFNKYLPKKKLNKIEKEFSEQREFIRSDGVLSTGDWPEGMEESEIWSKIHEANKYINTYDVKGLWDPWAELLLYYGYSSDGLLIQFVCDEAGNHIIHFPIYL